MIPESLRPTLTKLRLLAERLERNHLPRIAAHQEAIVRLAREIDAAHSAYQSAAREAGYCGRCEQALSLCTCPLPMAMPTLTRLMNEQPVLCGYRTPDDMARAVIEQQEQAREHRRDRWPT